MQSEIGVFTCSVEQVLYILIRVLQKCLVNAGRLTVTYPYLAACNLDIRSLDPLCVVALNHSSAAFFCDRELMLWRLTSVHFLFKVVGQLSLHDVSLQS